MSKHIDIRVSNVLEITFHISKAVQSIILKLKQKSNQNPIKLSPCHLLSYEQAVWKSLVEKFSVLKQTTAQKEDEYSGLLALFKEVSTRARVVD